MERGGAPAREISFVSLVAYGPKVSDSALAMGGYSFWNQAGRFPTPREFEPIGLRSLGAGFIKTSPRAYNVQLGGDHHRWTETYS